MAFIIRPRVKETSTTTGTGALTLAGAVSGFRPFTDVGDGNTFPYAVLQGSETAPTAWEEGIGTFTLAGTTLTRTTVLRNSSGGTTAINLAAGTHTVLLCWPAMLQQGGYLAHLAGANADTTLAVGQMHVVDMSAWATADRTYTLPSPANVGDRVSVMVSAGNATYELILVASSSGGINGGSASAEWSRLFTTGEVVTFRCVAAPSTWVVEYDGRIACKMVLRLTTGTNTTEAAATLVVPTDRGGVWTADVNVGSAGTTADSKFNFRRAGTVNIFGRALTQVSVSDAKYFTVAVWNGTTTYAIQQVSQGAAAIPQYSYAGAVSLAAGAYLQMRYRSEEGSKGLNTDSTFCVMEQL